MLGFQGGVSIPLVKGGVVPLGQCPDVECGALCSPAYGYVCALEQRLAAMHDVLARLLRWAESLGGWKAPVWEDARRLLTQAVAVSTDPAPDRAVAPSFFGRPPGQLP